MAKAAKEQNTERPVTPVSDAPQEVKEVPVNAEEAPKGKYVVAQYFRDIVDFSIEHKVGDKVDFAEGTRLQELIEAGLVKEAK